MFGQEKYERLLQRRPHTGRFFDRPHWTRRRFMELMGAGVTASFLPQRGWTADLEVIERAAVTTQNRAKNVIYILFNGGMTHVDTFDLKVYNGVVTSRVTAGNAAGLLAKSLSMTNDQFVDHLFLTVLSRYPTAAEKNAGVSGLQTGTRNQKAEQLLWSLYNKVDFIFNY